MNTFHIGCSMQGSITVAPGFKSILLDSVHIGQFLSSCNTIFHDHQISLLN